MQDTLSQPTPTDQPGSSDLGGSALQGASTHPTPATPADQRGASDLGGSALQGASVHPTIPTTDLGASALQGALSQPTSSPPSSSTITATTVPPLPTSAQISRLQGGLSVHGPNLVVDAIQSVGKASLVSLLRWYDDTDVFRARFLHESDVIGALSRAMKTYNCNARSPWVTTDDDIKS